MYDELPSEFAPLFDTASNTSGALSGAFIAGVIVGLLIVLAVVALIVIANCFIFKKAGENWWKGLIPLYNSWVQTRIGGLGWWWFLIFVVLTGLNEMVGASQSVEDKFNITINFTISMSMLLTAYNYNYNICKKFGKSGGFALLCTLLPYVGLPILGFGSAKYDKSIKTDQNGIFSV